MCRRCGEPDKRGSSRARRRRRDRMLAEHGNGTVCPCYWCGALLGAVAGYLTVAGTRARVRVQRLEQDRIIPGGTYAYWNVVPACRGCNHARAVDEQDWTEGCDYGGPRRPWPVAV